MIKLGKYYTSFIIDREDGTLEFKAEGNLSSLPEAGDIILYKGIACRVKALIEESELLVELCTSKRKDCIEVI